MFFKFGEIRAFAARRRLLPAISLMVLVAGGWTGSSPARLHVAGRAERAAAKSGDNVRWQDLFERAALHNVSPKGLSTPVRSKAENRASRSGGLRTPVSSRSNDSELQHALHWAHSWAARAVAQCESGGDLTAVSGTGKYRGLFQMDLSFWRQYGGRAFARLPDHASEAQQDLVAYRGWRKRGWRPWECADSRHVGLY